MKPSVRQTNTKDETEEVVTPPTKPKQLTLWDMKYFKTNDNEPQNDGADDMSDLYEKDPNDKTRPCTIHEVFTMMMNLQETIHKESREQEKRFQALLKAKDGKIEA